MTSIEPARTLEDLEWSRIVDAVGVRCRGPLGARIALPIASTPEGAVRASTETRQVALLLAAGESLPLDGVRELGPLLDRIARGGALDAQELRDVMLTLEAARSLRRFLSARKEELEALRKACPLDPTLDRLHEELAACVERDGTLADHASPELRKLRTETANLRARIVARLERILLDHADIVQDRFHTLREGRYVVPVRRDAHEKLQGIVHGTSVSGATVFVEPRALVAQGNRLKMAQAEQLREESRILSELSELVRERLAELRAAADAIDHADLRQASARLGVDLNARVLEASEDAALVDLRDARHPLLVLDGVEVVPCDIRLRRGHGLLLSGPNAGGKTVALKTVGLAALMHRAGLPVCAAEGSRCGFFAPVLTDVGDEQSIQKNLSTFSAHITNVARILERTQPGALVLLDELATGTDPGEGAALACALVDALLRAGAALGVTTHYEALKAMATRDERLANAAVGFDVERMMPTFMLHHGAPGASSALAVAGRFGIPASVLEVARAVLPEQARTFDDLVRRLDGQRQELALERAGVQAERARLEGESARIQAERDALASRGRDAIDDLSDKVLDDLRHARRELRKIRKEIRKQKDEEALEAAHRRMEKVAAEVEEVRPEPPPPEGAPLESVDVGDTVWVQRLRSTAQVLDVRKKKARVQAGPLKLWIEVKALRSAEGASAGGAGKGRAAARDAAKRNGAARDANVPRRSSPRTSDNTLDIRGLRVDDAISMAESFLDRLYGASEGTGYIVHGVGSGALRDAIRAQLDGDASRYVASYRSGTTEEGGDRLTIVTLRD